MMDDSDKQKAVSDFMLAEFNALQERARDIDQLDATRINFFLVIVGAVAAGLLAAADSPSFQGYFELGALWALVALLLLGLVALHYSIGDSIRLVVFHRLAGRVRHWYAEQAPDVAPHFPFPAADDSPRFGTPAWILRGGQALLLAVNAALASVLAAMILFRATGSTNNVILMGVGAGLFFLILQRTYIWLRMNLAARGEWVQDLIRFPSKQGPDDLTRLAKWLDRARKAGRACANRLLQKIHHRQD